MGAVNRISKGQAATILLLFCLTMSDAFVYWVPIFKHKIVTRRYIPPPPPKPPQKMMKQCGKCEWSSDSGGSEQWPRGWGWNRWNGHGHRHDGWGWKMRQSQSHPSHSHSHGWNRRHGQHHPQNISSAL